MATPTSFNMMAQYNHWMNERLYALCADLDEETRRADRGAFFQSIYGTLNHILLGDKVWLSRFGVESFKPTSLGQELHPDFAGLRAEREQKDRLLLDWTATLSAEQLAAPVHYTTMAGVAMAPPLWVPLTHMFNHQTHHRGQLTTLLSQLGIDPGVTDLIAMPGLPGCP
jgi:uncharacterized damage-inducible protein DinB